MNQKEKTIIKDSGKQLINFKNYYMEDASKSSKRTLKFKPLIRYNVFFYLLSR
jgi:hypothetical protein